MVSRRITGHTVSKGRSEGIALVCTEPISFLGGVDPETGIILKGECKGQSVAGKVLVFPSGMGSTVGSYVIYQMAKNGVAPCAIINIETEPIVAVGAVISAIPLIDRLKENLFDVIRDGDKVLVDASEGYVEVQ